MEIALHVLESDVLVAMPSSSSMLKCEKLHVVSCAAEVTGWACWRQALRERMSAGRKLAEAVRSTLPGFRGSCTPELGVSRSGRGRKMRKVRDATPTPEPALAEPREASIENLRELHCLVLALHLTFPELDALRDTIACFEDVQVWRALSFVHIHLHSKASPLILSVQVRSCR